MPRWTEDRAAQSATHGLRRGVGVVVARSAQVGGAHDVLLYEVIQDHGDAESLERATWRCIRGVGLDAAGHVPGWREFAIVDVPHVPGLSTRREFVGAAASSQDEGADLLFTRYQYMAVGDWGLGQTVSLQHSLYRDTPLTLDPAFAWGDATDVRIAVGDIGRQPPNKDLLLATRRHSGQVVYRIGWEFAGGDAQRGWSSDRAVPHLFPSTGFGVAVIAHGSARHLVFVGLTPQGGGYAAHYCIGHDIDTAGNVARWGAWTEIPGLLPAQLTGLDITVADLEQDGRPDLIVASQGDFGLRYRIGFNILDLAAEPIQATPTMQRTAVSVTTRRRMPGR